MEKVQWELPKLVREVECVTLTGRIMSLHAEEEMGKAKSRFYWYLQLPKQRIKRRWILRMCLSASQRYMAVRRGKGCKFECGKFSLRLWWVDLGWWPVTHQLLSRYFCLMGQGRQGEKAPELR